jgi:dolichyl-phosphate-mannose-protein mannosyltransferase
VSEADRSGAPTPAAARGQRPHGRAGSRRVLVLVLAILLVAAGLRLYRLGTPGEMMVDELFYAKDAKAIVDGRVGPGKGWLRWEPGDESWAHPEAGKLAIALGILLFGDRSFGWRVPAAVAGMAILACIYPIAVRLGLPPRWAVVALLFAACDFLGLAMSRIAMLDIFVAAWTVVCIYAALRYVQEGERLRWLLATGLAGGLAVATKWSGALAVIAAVVIVALAHLWRGESLSPPGGGDLPTRRRAWWSTALLVAAGLVALPAVVYVASYVQYFASGHTVADFRELHRQMMQSNLRMHAEHGYASLAPTWILDYRAWWNYSVVENGTARAVIVLGNPLLWWASLAALVAAPVVALRRGATEALVPALLVVILYVPWFATSRTSFIFYMTPVAPFLAVLLAATLWRLEGGRSEGPSRAWPWPALVVAAAAAVATAFFWWPLGRVAERLVGKLPEHAGIASYLIVAGSAIAAATFLVLAVAVVPRLRSLRPYLAWATVGLVCGILIPFLPLLLGTPLPYQEFTHLIWFRSWI